MATVRCQFILPLPPSFPGLVVADHSLMNDAPIIAKGSGNLFQIVPVDNTRASIVVDYSGKVLDVLYASTAEGAGLVQHDYNGGSNQLFQINPTSLNSSDVTILASHSGMYLTAATGPNIYDRSIVQHSRYEAVPVDPQVWRMMTTLTY